MQTTQKNFCWICADPIRTDEIDDMQYTVDAELGHYWFTCAKECCREFNRKWKETSQINARLEQLIHYFDKR